MEEPPQLQSILKSSNISSQEARSILAQFLTAQKTFLASFQNNNEKSAEFKEGSAQERNGANSIAAERSDNNADYDIFEDEEEDYILDESAVVITAREMTARLKGVLSCLSNGSNGDDKTINSTNAVDDNDGGKFAKDMEQSRSQSECEIVEINTEVDHNIQNNKEKIDNLISPLTPMTEKEKRSIAKEERRRARKEKHEKKAMKREKKALKKEKKRKSSELKDKSGRESKRMRDQE